MQTDADKWSKAEECHSDLRDHNHCGAQGPEHRTNYGLTPRNVVSSWKANSLATHIDSVVPCEMYAHSEGINVGVKDYRRVQSDGSG